MLNRSKQLERTKYARHIDVSLSSKFNSGILTIIYDSAWSAGKSCIRPRESAERFSNSPLGSSRAWSELTLELGGPREAIKHK